MTPADVAVNRDRVDGSRIDPPIVQRSRGWLALVNVIAAALIIIPPVATTVAVGATQYELLHRAYPGPDVALLTALMRSIADAAALIVAGCLVHVLFLRNAIPRRARLLTESFELQLLRWASAVWALAAGALVVLTALDQNGFPLNRLGEPGALAYLYEGSDYPRAWTVALVAAVIVHIASWFSVLWTGLLIPLWATAIGILAPVVVGQVLVGPAHDFGGDAAVLQTIALSAALGSIVVAALRVATGRLVSLVAIHRMLLISAVALPVAIVTDMIIAAFKLAGTALLASPTGWQILAGWVALATASSLTIAAGLRWRRGLLTLRFISIWLAGSAIASAAWVGIAVAMTRIPPPQYFVPTSISEVLMGYEVPQAPTFLVLITNWRPNILFLAIAIAAVTVYLVAVTTLRRRGDSWPKGRTIAWVIGWAVVVVGTSSGFGKYSAPDFGIHMIVHMSLNMLAPLLLVLGGVLTLLLRATRSNPRGPASIHDWLTQILHWPVLRFIYNPLIVFVVFIGSYYGLYLTGLFGQMMPYHWSHQLMNLHFLVVGYLYYSLIIGVDRPPRPLPHIGKLGFVLAAMPFHAFFGIVLMTSTDIIAENFYQNLNLPWADLAAAQYLGGGVAWAGGELPLMIVIVVLAIQWSRQDGREARTKDRHLDTGRDDEYEEYNRMLARLAQRQTPAPRRADADQKEVSS